MKEQIFENILGNFTKGVKLRRFDEYTKEESEKLREMELEKRRHKSNTKQKNQKEIELEEEKKRHAAIEKETLKK